MGSLALLQSLKDSVLGQANVKTIYGEPISAHEKTIIPVAKIMYGYGSGAGAPLIDDTSTRGEGGGGGGGVRAVPVGVIEVSHQQTRQAAWADRRPSRKVTVNSLDRLTFSLNCSKTVASCPGGLQPQFMPNSSQIPRSLLLTGDFTNY